MTVTIQQYPRIKRDKGISEMKTINWKNSSSSVVTYRIRMHHRCKLQHDHSVKVDIQKETIADRDEK